MDVNLKSVPLFMKPNPNVLFKRLGDEMVLFNLDTDHFYELNGTAARFWELLSSGQEANQVNAQMLDEFVVEPEQLAREAEALLASLRKENLVINDE
jgi:hypothetical protein